MKYRMQILPMASPLWNWPQIKAIALSISGNHSWRGCGLSGIACGPKWMNATNRLKFIDKFSMFEIFLWNKNHRSETTAIRIFRRFKCSMTCTIFFPIFMSCYLISLQKHLRTNSFFGLLETHTAVYRKTILFSFVSDLFFVKYFHIEITM